MEAKVNSSKHAMALVAALVTGCATPSTPQWALQASATTGAAIVLNDRAREFRIACRMNPSDLYVSISGEVPRPAARSIALTSGGHSVMLDVTTTGDEGIVEAAGAADERLLFMLNGNAPIVLEYAGGSFALPPLDELTRGKMAVACARSAGVPVQ
jgi:hypothetical protein